MPRKASLVEMRPVKDLVFVECLSESRLKYMWLGSRTFNIYALTSNRMLSMDSSVSSPLLGAATLLIYLCPYYRMRMYVIPKDMSPYHMYELRPEDPQIPLSTYGRACIRSMARPP